MVNRLTSEERAKRSKELGILVDPQDEWLLSAFTWRISTKGYIETTMYDGAWRATVKLHHFITGVPIWEGKHIDHKNRNKIDNRRDNLRWVDVYQSSQNRTYVDNARHIHVSRNGKFEARTSVRGVPYHIGTFETEQEAKNAYDTFQVQLQSETDNSR
jgi:hypothetical protein